MVGTIVIVMKPSVSTGGVNNSGLTYPRSQSKGLVNSRKIFYKQNISRYSTLATGRCKGGGRNLPPFTSQVMNQKIKVLVNGDEFSMNIC
jgi:hypothetical protein